MEKTLYRSRRDRIIAGVCGGLAEYLDVDPTLIRVAAVLLAAVTSGGIVLAYIILAIVVPEEPLEHVRFDGGDAEMSAEGPSTGTGPVGPGQTPTEPGTPAPPPAAGPPPTAPMGGEGPERRRRGAPVAGLVLIVLGVVFLLDQLVPGFSFARYWPVLLIALGIWIMVRPREER